MAFGSISGYYGIFDYQKNNLILSEKCDIELVRQVKIIKDLLYVAIGDQEILVLKTKDLSQVDRISFQLFVHSD